MLQRRAPQDTVRSHRPSLLLLHLQVVATVVHPPLCKPAAPVASTSDFYQVMPYSSYMAVDTRVWTVATVYTRDRMVLATRNLG